ncbi:MAG: DUF4325 domain-containing protein [Methylophilus sp.]|nr:STAS-like domain-containing protein [Methylophilus sp.]
MSANIHRTENEIVVEGNLDDFHYFLAILHQAIQKLGFSEIIINLSRCETAFPNVMLSICAQIMVYRKAGADFKLIPPANTELFNLFKNTGWAHFIDSENYPPSSFRGHTRVPATQYISSSDQQHAVNRIVNVILGAIPDLNRSDFAAFEWAINEITDNVLVHSESVIGGLVQVSTFQRLTKTVQFVVADAGIGIPKTLRSAFPDISDIEALDIAIKEGVTRDKKIGQGNGLFGTYEICAKSGGSFSLYSGHAKLEYSEKSGLSIKNEKIPYSGTLVIANLDFSKPRLLEDALKIKGKNYQPLDYIETKYETTTDGKIYFLLKDEAQSFGSRVSGRPIRNKLSNLIKMTSDQKIIIDFDCVPIVSSSFADEVFGKIFLEVGAMNFMQKFEFINMMDTVQSLINKAISQRMQAGVLD